MAESTTFSSSGAEIIARPLEAVPDGSADSLTTEEFEDYYDITRTAQGIIEGDYNRIALQFPDELLHDSTTIFRILKEKIGGKRELYVLADTSYGSCCVDEVAASHVNADAMVHYGHACMSKTYRLPVIYVFGKKPIDVSDCVTRLLEVHQKSDNPQNEVFLRADVAYAHKIDDIKASILNVSPGMVLSYAKPPMILQPSTESIQPSETPVGDKDPTSPRTIFYIGPESLGLTNLLMTHADYTVRYCFS